MEVSIVFFFISLGLSLGLLLLSLIFRIAGKLRLGIPLLYVLVVSFGFPGWASKNELLANGILGVLLGIVLISWVVTLIRKIRDWRADRQMTRSLEVQLAFACQNGAQDISVEMYDGQPVVIYQ
ncbi:MAG TPA: hypothetical protein H9694_09565 [Firmicutes bacterium]|nr:hypothetical protein [Bacillota bacterium]